MPFRLALVALAATAVAPTLDAQTKTRPSIPNTPVGTVVKAWQEAFGSSDTTRVTEFYRRYQPDRLARGPLLYRTGAGGFDILSIEQAEPRHIEFLARERKTPQTYYAIVDLADTNPPRIATSSLILLGPNATLEMLKVDATARSRVLGRAITLLDSFYVFPDVARRMADSLLARNTRGAYDPYTNAIAFSVKLNNDVRALSRDKHMRVTYNVRPLPPPPTAPRAPTPDEIARERAQLDAINCGFMKTEWIDGNVGYVKFNAFFDVEQCAGTASAAMNFIAASRALIIDLRENGGGSPEMVAYVSSYLFSTRTHLNDLWERATNGHRCRRTRDCSANDSGDRASLTVADRCP